MALVPGGLSLREGMAMVETIYEAGNMVSMDLMEVNPALGNDKDRVMTTTAVRHILINAFGYNRGGNARGTIPLP